MATTFEIVNALSAQISAACPIEGVGIGKLADKSTWRVDYMPAATPAQKQAADSVIASFDPASVSSPDVVDLIDVLQFKVLFNHENRLRTLEGKAQVTPTQFRGALRALT